VTTRRLLLLWFTFVLAAMLGVTIWASLDRDVLTAGAELWRDPWGRATLFDAYFAFVAVWLWIAWRERGLATRLGWLAGILLLGNFAIAVYALGALARDRRADGLAALFASRQRAIRRPPP
jgi:hypothetical protein